MMVGTVSYMPPEQALGGTVTPQSDLYSLGAMLYELVTGRPPFLGDDTIAIIGQHLNTPPVAPSWRSDRCPPDLEALIMRLLEKDPTKRPASASEVLEALGRVDPAGKSASHTGSEENPLERLRRGFDEAFSGRGSLLMLVGQPGIGKTRTTQEMETYARMRGAQALCGRSHESGGAPAFWPWVQIGRAYGAVTDAAQVQSDIGSQGPELLRLFPELKQLIPDIGDPMPMTDPQSAQFRMFDAYVTFIRAASSRMPLVLILDDLHWADKPTLLLLQHLAREVSSMRVLLVGTYRDTDLSRTHPLSESLATLNREPGFQRLNLRGLSQEEVGEYVRVTAGVTPSRRLLEKLYEETEGNPFFLQEVVALLTQEGTLTKDTLEDIAIPDGVKEALGRRLDLLSPEANEPLTLAAVMGRDFGFDLLKAVGEQL
jgi:predicted ATPase